MFSPTREFSHYHDLPVAEQTWQERFYIWRLEHPWWQCGRGSGDGIFFVRNYDFEDTWYGRFLLEPIYWLGCRYDKLRRWIKARTFWGMHIIKTDLAPSTYYDPDMQMLYAMMAINDRYIGEGEHIIDVGQEFIDVAHWWHIDRVADKKRREEIVDILFGDKGLITMRSEPHDNPKLHRLEFDYKPDANELKKEKDDLDAKMNGDEENALMQLVKLRNYMWI